MPLSLEEYDRRIGHHLRMIATCARSIVAHANAMSMRPDFATMSEDDLVQCQDRLTEVLGQVRTAINTIREKPIDV